MRLTYSQRAKFAVNKLAYKLFHLMEEKKSNLCFAVDVTDQNEVLRLADLMGPKIAILKTHVDIFTNFTFDFTYKLKELSEKHGFLIFEDRKFADIGNTVKLQYEGGIYRIVEWSDMVNAHILFGPSIIEGLKMVGLQKERALILLAELSSKGALTDKTYAQKAVQMAKANRDFVLGFICQNKIADDPEFIHLTPGINLAKKGDAMGQQYLTPERAFRENQIDVIIVGRGILEAQDPLAEAERYRDEGWKAYLSIIS